MEVGIGGQAGTLELQNGAASTQTIAFDAGMLKLDQLSTSPELARARRRVSKFRGDRNDLVRSG